MPHSSPNTSASLFQKTGNRQQRQTISPNGFSLIIAITLMALTFLVLIGLSTSALTHLSVTRNQSNITQARQNALLGLQVAMGQLQVAAGPDQRITAPADLAGASDDLKNYIGVWDTTNPTAAPTWLVSGGFNPTTNSPGWNASGEAKSTNDILLVGKNSVNASIDTNGSGLPDDIITAPKEMIISDGIDTGAFAYWIGDESQKARVNLFSQGSGWEGIDQNLQATMDFNTLTQQGLDELAGLESIDISEPGKIARSYELSDISAGTGVDEPTLGQYFHSLTFHSTGIPTNVVNGGLKKDLSLAFEMDEDDFRDSEFAAGSSDSYTNIIDSPNYEVEFLFKEPANGGDIRGPTWELLRNHYRLYKKVADANDAPVITARPSYPNTLEQQNQSGNSGDKSYIYQMSKGGSGTVDPFIADQIHGADVAYPSEQQIMPLVQRVMFFLTLKNINGNLNIVLKPFVVLWNPYNVSLEFDAMRVTARSVDFQINVTVKESEFGPVKTITEIDANNNPITRELRGNGTLQSYFEKKLGASNQYFQLVIKKDTGSNFSAPLSLEPGEIQIYSAANSTPQPISTFTLIMNEGFNFAGGFSMDEFPYGEYTGNRIRTINELDSGLIPMSSIDADDWIETGIRTAYDGGRYFRIDTTYVESESLPAAIDNASQRAQSNKEDRTNYKHFSMQTDNVYEFHHQNNLGSVFDPSGADAGNNSGHGVSASLLKNDPQYEEPFVSFDHYLKPIADDHRPISTGGWTNPRAMFTSLQGSDGDVLDESSFGGFNTVISAPATFEQHMPQDDTFGRGYWGRTDESQEGSTHITMFDLPTTPPLSLADFRHADIFSFYRTPAYAIGNSRANPFISRDKRWEKLVYVSTPDLSLLANEALFDDYFLSGITPEFNNASSNYSDKRSVAKVIEDYSNEDSDLFSINPRMAFAEERTLSDVTDTLLSGNELDATAYQRSATYIDILGAFNVNSTNVNAWKTLLASMKKTQMSVINSDGSLSLLTDGTSPDTNNPFNNAIWGRVQNPLTNVTNGSSTGWRGWENLDDNQLDDLATEIVNQVKLRGPFMSMADFVNRSLENDETGIAGALQAAIDTANINADVLNVVGSQTEYTGFDLSDTDPNKRNFVDVEHSYGQSGDGVPGFMTQGDLLAPIAPVLTVRSDTFKIRSYGESINPITGKTDGKAWCEAIVQRIPDYIDPTLNGGEAPWNAPTGINDTLGRSFVVKSIRWLNENEI
ncbi:hypothetical protein [Rubellicoccus peritrichatus]|uniref:Uncharacterized protein n=1 Tax=Rubellicoccus peritrichatus TaxID=3080537 RepID=A0AAQ3LCQ8_9BACT|nr:hypothetical protein [Puniceicoccus sp. CR14]WOO41485.1 hypothetical protein RZN69_00190 [Puniceicoccus sp. CR14]